MPLSPGTQLGPYQILDPLGAGGMGEVYRCRDNRLNRTVALKILPKEMSSDPLLKQRFEREARIISSLNHPHICVLHDIGSQDGVDYLVMECIEGETLAKRLAKGPLQLEQVLKFGSQIADALDKAHRSGVIHRDLKPGNIMLTPTGTKLLDFGLAKPAVSLLSAATLTATAPDSPVTEQGTIVGTFQYMSPEQIEGRELDGRSDIFSLGTVLYEMLTGKRAFEGKSRLSVASAILEKDPTPIRSIKPLTPPELNHAIGRSLAKDPNERWQIARDLSFELRWIAENCSQTGVLAPAVRPDRTPKWLMVAVVALLILLSIGGFIAYLRLYTSTAPVVVSDIAPPRGTQLNLSNGVPVVSPDGRSLLFSAIDPDGKSSLWIRSLDGSPARRIPGTEDAGSPFWSADSQKIGFFSDRKLTTMDISAGSTQAVSDTVALGGAAWASTGSIVFIGANGIYQVQASGGPAVQVLRRDTAKYAFLTWVRFLPDGKHFLYTAANPGTSGDTYFASLDGKENRLLLQGSGQTSYASGFLLYTRSANLVAQPFDTVKGQLMGTAYPIAEQVQQNAFNSFFDVSQTGVLLYEPATHAPTTTQLALFDRAGKKLTPVGSPAIHYDVRLSPDARRLAFSAGAPKSEIWVYDLTRGVPMRLTFDPDTDHGIPVWSPDGSSLLFSTLRGSKAGVGIFQKGSNGAGDEELLLRSDRPEREAWATDWSPDGRYLLFSRGDMANNSEGEIWVLPLNRERKPILFLQARAAYDAHFSPDGRWVAYTSRESGSQEVYVTSFDPTKLIGGASGTPGGKWQISNDGGNTPRWRRDGKEIFYIGPQNTITAAEVEGKGTSFEVGRSQRLFVAPVSPFSSTYDVTPNGQRFVMSTSPEQEVRPLVLMLNWTELVKGK
jgi:serine/threonine protein kinase